MKRSKANGAEDAAFFKTLLDATVYMHLPKDRHKFFWLHAISVIGRAGMLVPFFTKRSRAEKSTQHVARVIAMKGRAFLEASRGSTLILNPEETPCCILYPEQVASLFDESYMARVEAFSIDEEGPLACALDSVPEGLVGILIPVLRDLLFVEVAYVARRTSNGVQDPSAALIVLGGDRKLAERAVIAAVSSSWRWIRRSHATSPPSACTASRRVTPAARVKRSRGWAAVSSSASCPTNRCSRPKARCAKT